MSIHLGNTSGGFQYSYRDPMPGAGPGRDKSGHLFILQLNQRDIDRLKRRLGPGLRRKVAGRLLSHNARMARELAELAGEILTQRTVRQRTSTGRLRRAILDPGNRSHSGTGYAVGHVEFMDRSEAKYWRAIERGTDYFVGRPIRGIWASRSLGPGRRQASGPYSGMGGGDGQDKFIPFSSRASAAMFLRDEGVTSSQRTRTVRRFEGVIGKPIMAHRYYRDAWRQYDPVRRGAQAINEVLREVLRED